MSAPILYVDHAEWLGGAEESLLVLLRRLDRRRYAPLLACNADGPLGPAAEAAGAAVYPLPLGKLRGRRDLAGLGRDWRRGVVALRELIRAEGVRAVHSNVMRASLYAAPAARRAGVPLVWHVRDIHAERLYLWAMSALAGRIIAISEATARPLPAWGRRKLRVIPNGVELSRFAPDAAARQAMRAGWGAADEQVWIGTAGWLAPWKQTELFLEAAEWLAERRPACRFVIVGEAAHPSYADYVAGLRARAAATLGERCLFLGRRSDMPQVLAGLDLLWHTARAEPFGRVLIEAMAAGRPAVAFADGGAPEIIADGETGRLIAPGAARQMAEATLSLADDADLRRRMGQAGRRRALSQFSAEQMAARVEEVYATLI